MKLTHHNQCPVCKSADIRFFLETQDYYSASGSGFPVMPFISPNSAEKHDPGTLSPLKSDFAVWICNQCGSGFTQDAPDSESITPFYRIENYISHTNTRKGIIHLLYQTVRKVTLWQKYRLISKALGRKQGLLLDVGTGTALFPAYMKARGWTVAAVESDNLAREKAIREQQLEVLDPQVLPSLPKHHFDVITLWHVLEHVHDLHGYAAQFHKLLKPGGVLIIAVPNYTSYDAQVYGSFWAAYDVPRHLYHFSPQSMRAFLNQHGFSVVQTRPMWFDSFYVSLLSEYYRSGRHRFLSGLWTGALANFRALLHTEKCSSVIYVARPTSL